MNDKEDFLAINHAFYRAFAKRDLKAMTDLWSNGTGSLCVDPRTNSIQGWEDIQKSWTQIFCSARQVEIDITIITTEVKGDIAYVVLTENWTQVFKWERRQAQSIGTNIFERLGQKWYLVHHHSSPILQPQQSPPRRLFSSLCFWN